MNARAPKGTADMLPDVARVWEHLLRTAQELFARYGYEPIYTPLFEHTEVFTRGIGEATDIVSKEMYTFEDRSGQLLDPASRGDGVCRARGAAAQPGPAGLDLKALLRRSHVPLRAPAEGSLCVSSGRSVSRPWAPRVQASTPRSSRCCGASSRPLACLAIA